MISECPSPSPVLSQPTDFRDPWIGPETHAESFFSSGDVRKSLPDPTVLSPLPIRIPPESECEHTRHDGPMPSFPLAIDTEPQAGGRDENPPTSSPPPGDADTEGVNDNTEEGEATDEDQLLESNSDAPVQQYTGMLSNSPIVPCDYLWDLERLFQR